MTTRFTSLPRCGALLAINLLFLMLWGFAGVGKVVQGIPSWFGDKFGATVLASFPGLVATFWILALSELLALAMASIALLRGEFLGRRPANWLALSLVWSLFVFVQLALGQWLTADYNGAAQIFAYFGVTLIAVHYVTPSMATRS